MFYRRKRRLRRARTNPSLSGVPYLPRGHWWRMIQHRKKRSLSNHRWNPPNHRPISTLTDVNQHRPNVNHATRPILARSTLLRFHRWWVFDPMFLFHRRRPGNISRTPTLAITLSTTTSTMKARMLPGATKTSITKMKPVIMIQLIPIIHAIINWWRIIRIRIIEVTRR